MSSIVELLPDGHSSGCSQKMVTCCLLSGLYQHTHYMACMHRVQRQLHKYSRERAVCLHWVPSCDFDHSHPILVFKNCIHSMGRPANDANTLRALISSIMGEPVAEPSYHNGNQKPGSMRNTYMCCRYCCSVAKGLLDCLNQFSCVHGGLCRALWKRWPPQGTSSRLCTTTACVWLTKVSN